MRRLRTVLFALVAAGLFVGAAWGQVAFTITTPSPLPEGTAGTPYSLQLQAAGGTQPYTWFLVTGTLPPGLTLSSQGLISGVPTQAGFYGQVIEVTDATGAIAQPKSFDLHINLGITTASPLPNGAVGAAYSVGLTAIGGSPPYFWDLVAGNLPPGLNLDSSGVLSGTPTQVGTFTFQVEVFDRLEDFGTKTFNLTIDPALTITTSSLPNGTVGVNYSTVMAATGGIQPYTWQIVEGALPQGLVLNSITGAITGIPLPEGNFIVQIGVTDARQQSTSKVFTLLVNPPLPLSITTTSPLPNGFVGDPYSFTLAATGGVPAYFWTVVGGELPPGLELALDGVIRGIPNTAGVFEFEVQALDQRQNAATRLFTLTIVGELTITTESLGDGTVDEPYSQELAATGGVPPYTWSISGALPPGLSLNRSEGVISGTPTQAGTFEFTIQVMDTVESTATRSFQITVVEAIPPLEITTSSPLPEGQAGAEYSQQLGATGGSPPYEWTVVEGGLPPGLELSTGGVISGTPSEAGEFGFLVRVTDSREETAERGFQLVIRRGPLTIISDGILPQAEVGVAYSFTFEAAGGTPPYAQWSVIVGAPPSGLTLSEGGVLSGTPTLNDDFGFRVQVTDSAGGTAEKNFAIRVTGMPAPPEVSLGGLPGQTDPAQPQTLRVDLSAPYPAALTGIATLAFTSEAVVPADDPAVQFATGGRTAEFTIPAGGTGALFGSADSIGVQTGSVAGRILVTVRIFAGEQDITPSPEPAHEMEVRRVAPVIRSVRATRTANGLEVRVVGISSPREVTQARFQFTAASGANLQTTEATVNVGQAFGNWYQSANSVQFGSAFEYVQPFSVTGSTTDVTAVSVTLTNSQGNSQAMSANF